jgi:hypothetical protein
LAAQRRRRAPRRRRRAPGRRKAAQWLEALPEGGHPTRAHPAWHLRRKLGGRQALTKPLRPLEVAALAAKSRNAFAASDEVTGLTWTESRPKAEAFPPIR